MDKIATMKSIVFTFLLTLSLCAYSEGYSYGAVRFGSALHEGYNNGVASFLNQTSTNYTTTNISFCFK